MHTHLIVSDTHHLQKLSSQLSQFKFDQRIIQDYRTKQGLSYLQQAAYIGETLLTLQYSISELL